MASQYVVTLGGQDRERGACGVFSKALVLRHDHKQTTTQRN